MSAYLRPWDPADAKALAEVYANADAALLSNIPDDHSFEAAHGWIKDINSADVGDQVRAYVIVDRGTESDGHTDAGQEGSRDREEDTRDREEDNECEGQTERIFGNVMVSGVDRRHSIGWVSYWMTADARGRGLTSAGLRSLVDVAHDELGIYRLELGYRKNNPASAAVARNAGFIVEGIEREKLSYDGIRYDTEVCARLAGDPRSDGHRLPIDSPH